jgi:hypothetical protein
MITQTIFARMPALLTAALLAAACRDSLNSDRSGPAVPMFDVVAPPNVILDQKNGSFSESGTVLGMGFSTSPHHGDAIIATFFWRGSSNIITAVTDHLSAAGYPLVGNTYTLVEYVTDGGISMATYVATNVQNFPDGYNSPNGDSLLVVHATLSDSVSDGGVMLSAYTGVHAVYARALGAHRSASGFGSSTATTDGAAIGACSGALAYGVTMSSGLVGVTGPPGFTNISTMSDTAIKGDGEYVVQGGATYVRPQWTWFYTGQTPGTWLTTALVLNPATSITLDQCIGTLNERGSFLIKGFNPTNPHNGDAIIATFFWLGSTNIIDSVTDVITTAPYSPVGNRYTLVDYVTAGGMSMATYIATNVQNFPDGYQRLAQDSILAVRADLSQPVEDGGVLLSAWTGANTTLAQALGAHSSAAGSGSGPTIADPGAITVETGSLAYGVTLSGLFALEPPTGFATLMSLSDNSIKGVGEFGTQASTGSVEPRWTWYFGSGSPSSWMATVLALKRAGP